MYLSIGCVSLIIIETQFVDTSFSLFVLLCPADLIIKITKSKLVRYSGTEKKKFNIELSKDISEHVIV